MKKNIKFVDYRIGKYFFTVKFTRQTRDKILVQVFEHSDPHPKTVFQRIKHSITKELFKTEVWEFHKNKDLNDFAIELCNDAFDIRYDRDSFEEQWENLKTEIWGDDDWEEEEDD